MVDYCISFDRLNPVLSRNRELLRGLVVTEVIWHLK